MLNIGMCDVCFHGFNVTLREIWSGMGVRDQNKRYRKGYIEVDYNRRQKRFGVGSAKTENNGWDLKNVDISLRKKEADI